MMFNMFPIINDVVPTSKSNLVNNTVEQNDVSFTKRQLEQRSSGAQLGFFDDIALLSWYQISGNLRVVVGRRLKPFILFKKVGDVEMLAQWRYAACYA